MLSASAVFERGSLLLRWSNNAETADNWGDAINPELVGALSGRRVVPARAVINVLRRPVYTAVGSILDGASQSRLHIWGSGFKSENGRMRASPERVFAVRGPLTRQLLLKQGVECPVHYGDPALLYPLIYRPTRVASEKIGLVPHYSDADHPVVRQALGREGVRVLDVRAGNREFIDSIVSCDAILSSSLHGLIAAEAYGVPSAWIVLGDELTGGHFKFYDYYAALGVNRSPLTLEQLPAPESVGATVKLIGFGSLDRTTLLQCCPFVSEAWKGVSLE